MKKVLVTGATGSLGEAIVKYFASENYFVYIHYYHNKAKALSLLEEIHDQGEIVTFSMQDTVNIKEVLQNIHVDVLINNAGITRDNLFFWMGDEEWEEVIDTNVNGLFRVTKALLPQFITSKKGSIVNISSISGMVGNIGQANYAASKGAIIAFTKSLSLELARYKICVNCVAPGLVDSEMTKDLDANLKKSIPLRRYGTTDEIAHAVYFAATNTYMTGEVLNISGGMVR